MPPHHDLRESKQVRGQENQSGNDAFNQYCTSMSFQALDVPHLSVAAVYSVVRAVESGENDLTISLTGLSVDLETGQDTLE